MCYTHEVHGITANGTHFSKKDAQIKKNLAPLIQFELNQFFFIPMAKRILNMES